MFVPPKTYETPKIHVLTSFSVILLFYELSFSAKKPTAPYRVRGNKSYNEFWFGVDAFTENFTY